MLGDPHPHRPAHGGLKGYNSLMFLLELDKTKTTTLKKYFPLNTCCYLKQQQQQIIQLEKTAEVWKSSEADAPLPKSDFILQPQIKIIKIVTPGDLEGRHPYMPGHGATCR
jgi:hypothetical protein